MKTRVVNLLTDDEKEQLAAAVKQGAVAIAELWDVLRRFETARTGGGIETEIVLDLEALNLLAADCNTPPTFTDLTQDMILATVDEYATIRQIKVEKHVTGL